MKWIPAWNKKTLEKKHSRFSTLLSYQSVGQPLWSPDTFESYVTSGYQHNVIVYRCVTLIARSLSTIPLVLHDKGTKVDDHPLLTLLCQPNPLQNYQSFCEAVISYLLLSGNSYIEAVSPPDQDTPLELYTLRPDRMSIIPGKKGFPQGYEYAMGSSKTRIHVDPITGYSPILHLRLFNPLDDWYGMSPLQVSQQSVDLQNTVLSHNLALLQNEGRPSGALIVRNSLGLNDAQRAQLRDDLESLYAGKSNAGRMMVLEGDLEWKEMGFSPKDLDFSTGKTLSGRDIAQVFGVPPICVGILGDATFSNYREARQHLWEDTLLPLFENLLSHYNRWLSPLFGSDLILSYDKDSIHALGDKRDSVWARIQQAECLTLNEKRALLGYPPLPEGDSLSAEEGRRS